MKRKALLLLLMLALGAPWAAWAQEIVAPRVEFRTIDNTEASRVTTEEPMGNRATLSVPVVSGGTATNNRVPMYTYYCDYGFVSQYTIPASYFANAGILNGDQLTSFTIYQSSTSAWVAANLGIWIGNTTNSDLSGGTEESDDDTRVYYTSSYSSNSASSHTFTFSAPFTYTGNSLYIWIQSKSGGTYASSYWYGYTTNTTQAISWYYNSSGTATGSTSYTFLPNTTFTKSAPNPTTITCGTTYSGTLGTSGVWSNYTDGSWTEPGEEHVYAYTPPVTGDYTFTGTNDSGDADFFLMTANNNGSSSLGCWSSGSRTYTLTGGQTYYLVADNYSSSDNASYTITVSCPSFSITAWANPTGAGTITGAGTYTQNTSCTLTATAASGYAFDYWIKNGTETITSNPYTFTVTDDADFQAHFSQAASIPYTETFEGSHGWNFSNGSQTNQWYIGGPGAHDGSYGLFVTNDGGQNNAYNVSSAGVVYAYKRVNFASTGDYNLSFDLRQQGEGTWDMVGAMLYTSVPSAYTQSIGSGQTTFPSGYSQFIVGAGITESAGNWVTISQNFTVSTTGVYYLVFAWKNDTSGGTQPPASIDNVMVKSGAYYAINASANPSGYGTVSGGGVYANGTSVTLTATANTGYTFTNWTENGTVVSTNASYNFTVSGDRTLVANFTISTYSITANSNPSAGGYIQTTAEVGSGSIATDSYLPFYTTYNYNLTQQIYTPAEIGASGTITSIAFYNSGDTKTITDLEFYMVHTNKAAFASTTDWITVSSSDLVYSGNDIIFTQNDWTVITLDTPFSYDGSSNLALVSHEHMQWSSGPAFRVFTPTSGGNCSIRVYRDDSDYDPANPTQYTGTLMTVKNCLKINIETTSITQTAAHGTSLSFTAVPNTNYHFVNWTDNNASAGSNTTYTLSNIAANHTVVANFAPNTHTLTVSVDPANSGTISDGNGNISGDVTYNHGTEVSLTANAATGYTFQNWTIDGNTVSGNPTSVTMNGDHTVVANFTLNSYSVQVSANPSAGGTVTGGGTYNHGASCTVTATAEECYDFDGWYEGGTQVSSNASYTFNVTAGHSLEARFTKQTYTVTVSTEGGGTVSGGGEYECGTTASILATPDECHTFSHFIDGNGQTIAGFNPAPLLVDHDLAITAVFTAKTYTISATAYDDTNNTTGGGTVSGDGTLDCGSTCTLVATPATNYVFDNWTENGTVVMDNGSPAGASYSFTVSGARTLVAHFHLDAVSISATAYDDSNNAAGGGTISGTGSFNIGSTCELEATPNDGYEFVNWTENGTAVSTSATYSFTVSAARDLVAHFRLLEYTLTLTADPNNGGTVSASPSQAYYHYGDQVTITATANSGYTFGSWSDGGAAQHTVTITGNDSYTAYFGADHTLTTYATPMEGGYVTLAPVSDIGAVTVGNGTDHNNVSPFTSNNAYSFEECIYTASEINLPLGCTITSISYECTNGTSQSNHIEVFMKLVNYATFSGATTNPAYEEVTDNDKVFDGIWTITAPASSAKPDAIWNTIILDKPFVYDGTSNLMIGIHESTAGIAGGVDFSYSTVSNSSAICFSSDNKPNDMVPTDINDLKNGTLHERSKSSLRANVRLGFGTYHNGQSVTLTAHPNAGYQFVNWTENNQQVGTAGNATYTVTMDTDHTIYAHFERALKRFVTDGYWNVAGNWDPVGVPTPDISEDISIEAHAIIPDGVVAYADSIRPITHANSSITIKDGGQLVHNSAGLSLTAEKDIIGYTIDSAQTNWNYYLFSSPVIASATYTGIVTSEHYDLYSFDASADPLEWILSTPSDIAPYTGFIYASRTNTTITVSGTVPPSNTTPTHQLDYSTGRFVGWNLIGNPFVCNAYVTHDNNVTMDYYVLNHQTNYDEFYPASSSDPVAPLSALMVKASASGQSVTYSRTAPSPSAKTGILNIDVRTMERGSAMLDRARLRFGEGEGLEKFQFNPNHTKVYIPDGDKDFAVYYAQGAGTIPVNFKAENNGRYTLDFSTEDVGFNYLHLIDNMNGNDVDLLQTPYYSFDARSTDYASRFTIVFATGDSNDETFAFYNNGLWIINNDGEATLQVVDALGRILSSESISGSCSKAINAAPGVYMLRLINGNIVKVQKIVVRR